MNSNFNSFNFEPKIIKKNKLIAFLLAISLGFLGIHRFYLGKFITGFLQLILGLILFWGKLGWIIFMWVIIDIIRIIFDKEFTTKLQFSFFNFSFTKANTSESDFSEEPKIIKELSDEDVIVTDVKSKEINHK